MAHQWRCMMRMNGNDWLLEWSVKQDVDQPQIGRVPNVLKIAVERTGSWLNKKGMLLFCRIRQN
jgi:hypothetical protein